MAGDKYVSPVFSFSEEEHRELLDAARNVDLVLKGEAGHDVRTLYRDDLCIASD